MMVRYVEILGWKLAIRDEGCIPPSVPFLDTSPPKMLLEGLPFKMLSSECGAFSIY